MWISRRKTAAAGTSIVLCVVFTGKRAPVSKLKMCWTKICVDATLSAYTCISYNAFLECNEIALLKIVLCSSVSPCFIYMLPQRSFVWSWNVDRKPMSLPFRFIWTAVWIKYKNAILVKLSAFKLQIPCIFFDVCNWYQEQDKSETRNFSLSSSLEIWKNFPPAECKNASEVVTFLSLGLDY